MPSFSSYVITVKLKARDVRVTSRDVAFISSFVEIGHLVQKVKGGTQRQHSALLSLLSFLIKKENEARSLQASIPLIAIWCLEAQ
jgi:hypoxanthine-guanine phosphoribosyltransferase